MDYQSQCVLVWFSITLVERQAAANSAYAQVLRASQCAYEAGRQCTLSVIHLRVVRAALIDKQLPAGSAAARR